MFLSSKRFLFSKTSSRHLEDVFSVTIFYFPRRLQDIFKASSRCLQCIFSGPLHEVFKTSSQDDLKTFSSFLQDVSQDVFKTFLQDVIFKTCSKRLGRQKSVTLKTPSGLLQHLFSKANMFAGLLFLHNRVLRRTK